MNEYKNNLILDLEELKNDGAIRYESSAEKDDKDILRILNRTIRELKEKNEILEKERDEAVHNEDKLIDEYNELVEEYNANVEEFEELEEYIEKMEDAMLKYDEEIEDLLIKMDMQDEIIDGLAEKIEKNDEKMEDFNIKTTILFEVKHDRKQAQIIDDLNLLIDIKDNEIDILEDKLEKTNKVLFETDANYHYLKGCLIGIGYTVRD